MAITRVEVAVQAAAAWRVAAAGRGLVRGHVGRGRGLAPAHGRGPAPERGRERTWAGNSSRAAGAAAPCSTGGGA